MNQQCLLMTALFTGLTSCLYAQRGGGEPCGNAEAGMNVTINCGGSTVLGSGNYNSSYTYVWSPAAGLSSPYIHNPTASPKKTTKYTLTMIPDPNLIVNGDFESGNTGFSSDYTSGLVTGTVPMYTVADQGSDVYDWWCTTKAAGGNGMLVCDASYMNGERVWYQTVNVLQFTWFKFSGQFINLFNTNGYNDPNIVVKINGVTVAGGPIGFGSCIWETLDGGWYSGSSTTATIEIFSNPGTLNTGYGNDLGIDNLTLNSNPCTVITSEVTVTVNPNPPIITGAAVGCCGPPPTNTVTNKSDGEIISCDKYEWGQSVLLSTNAGTSNLNWYVDGNLMHNGSTYTAWGQVIWGAYSHSIVVENANNGCTTDPTPLTFVGLPEVLDVSYSNGVFTALTFDYYDPASPWIPTYTWNVPNAIFLTPTNQHQIQFTFDPNYHPPVVGTFMGNNVTTEVTLSVANSRYDCVNTTPAPQHWIMVNKAQVLPPKVKEGRSSVLSEEVKPPRIYPNPARSTVTVVSAKPFDKVQIFTATGVIKKLHAKKGTIAVIDVNDLSAGIYFVTIITANSVKTERLMIMR
jgi:hypothetical protein